MKKNILLINNLENKCEIYNTSRVTEFKTNFPFPDVDRSLSIYFFNSAQYEYRKITAVWD